MKTLIELYDERPLENIIAPEFFRPDTVVYLCQSEVLQNKKNQETIRDFFRMRGITSETVFLECSLYNTKKIVNQLRRVCEQYEDCVIDITGGTDAALYACGMFSAEMDIPVFTYSRRKKAFYNICNAEFAETVSCDIGYSVRDFFCMAGGGLREGRVDNAVLENYLPYFDMFFDIYMRYRRNWTQLISWCQKASPSDRPSELLLHVDSPYKLKGDRGTMVSPNPEALAELEKLGFLKNLSVTERERVSFDFASEEIRKWLRDVGSVLELFTYKACLDAGYFGDVYSSAVVDWEGDFRAGNVTNEIDAVAAAGLVPLFISCKTCEVKTEAVNELSILKDRFGGSMAMAAIVTTEKCAAITRRRAEKLGIAIFDVNDLKSEPLRELLKVYMEKAGAAG